MQALSLTHERAYVIRQTMVGVAINSSLSFVFAWLVAGARASIPLWGARGMAIDFIPQTIMMMFAMTLAVTLLTRRRIRMGELLPIDHAPRLPHNALLRALLVNVLTAAICCPATVAALHIADVRDLPVRSFIAMKVVYGAVVTFIVAPRIVRAALAGIT